MSDPKPDHLLVPPRDATSNAGRRRFLLQLGLLAGAGLAPFVARPSRGKDSGAAATSSSSLSSSRPARLETARPVLGTWVRVVVADGDERRAARAVEGAFRAIALVDAQMSIHRRDSQLARVNAAAGRGTVAVDPALVTVVSRACEASRETGGAYDPTILPLMRLYGFYGARRDRYPSDREIAAALDVTGHRHVIVDDAAGRIGLTRRGAALDLGSIGKGWALDRAVDAIRREGVNAALVDVGGNVYGLGAPDDRSDGWTVAVVHPERGSVDRTFTLRDQAIGTSGNSEQHHRIGRSEVGHLLDAVRGRPADGPRSATVRAWTGVESDVSSTVAFLLGPGRFRPTPAILDAHFIG
ncbi:MAG TPA: FAD:protein FMN transferase [Candidatus Eisenbacteria bacterium]|nr:FAD:protein FMN transferase [Candidatus Eisenbacteria bacterium]